MSRAWENSRLTWRLNRCERDPIRPLNWLADADEGCFVKRSLL